MAHSDSRDLIMTDLLRGWDDLTRLLSAHEADDVWVEVAAQPSWRVFAALRTATPCPRPDEGEAKNGWPDTCSDRVLAGQLATRS